MSLDRKRGFTLIEVLVGIFIGGIILTVIYELFILFGREAERPMASMTIEQSSLTASRWISKDLAETNLQSIRSYPSTANKNVYPALIMESARDINDDKFQMSAFGTPAWKKFVYYQVEKSSTKPGVGDLTYDEDATGVGVEPGGPSVFPAPHSKKFRVIATDLQLGNPGQHVGMYAYWNDSSNNPHDFESTNAERAEPVNVALTFVDTSPRTGKQTLRKLLLQIKPQN
jgi:prepilin-type N-terminal cleavage/methylation domain-containing protein